MISITSPQGPVVCLPHCTLTPLNASPSMAALLPPCVHLPDPNEYALCSLFSISCAWPSSPPHLFLPPPCMVHYPHPLLLLPHQHHLTCPAPFHHHSLTSPPLTPLYVLLHGLWPRRLAWHWPPTPQDHSGTLGAEEFKACLISLGFDIANDAQVLNCNHALTVRGLTGFFFCFSLAFSPLYFNPSPSILFLLFFLLSTCPSVVSPSPCNIHIANCVDFFLNSTLFLTFNASHGYPCPSFSVSLFSAWFCFSLADIL